jgi:hypothetical protein
VAVRVAEDGEIARKGDWVLAVSQTRLPDGRVLSWHSPQPVALNLLEAHRLAVRGARGRRKAMAQLRRRDDGTYGPVNGRTVIDCVADLQQAVFCAFAAVESLANHAVDMLDPATEVVDGRRTFTGSEIVRLSVDEKLKRVLPMMSGGRSPAGGAAWPRYRALKHLRDELVHVKERGYGPDPAVNSAYDRLVLGHGDDCAQVARAVIDAAWPGWLPEHVVEELTPSPAA